MIAMVSMLAYDKAQSRHPYFRAHPLRPQAPDRTGEGEVTAVLAIVTTKHELLKFPENLLGSQSLGP
jgi:hypothetical protein